MKTDATAKIPSQRRDIRNRAMAVVLFSFLSVVGTVRGQVTNIIYEDNFARTGVLSGSAPDTVNLPGATWFAADNPANNDVLMTDGSEIDCTNFPNPTNGLYLNGFLPFTPLPGHVYTLSCKICALSGGSQWLAMGFATQPITNNYYAAVNCGSEWTLVRGNGSGIQAFESPGGGSTATINANFGTTTNVFAVVLNTATNGTTAINADYGWVSTYYTNGIPVATNRIPYSNPPIQYVGIGADAATGLFQQFTLTDVLMFPGAPVISEQPNNRTAQVGQKATFWAGVTNDSPPASYQWMTNSTGGPTNAIVGATNSTYTTPALDMTYNGLNYSVAISNVYGATNSALATLTVVSGPPTVYSATKTGNATSVVVAFSKAVDPITGLNPGNYSLTVNGAPAGVSVVSASYGSASNSVVLTTSTLNPGSGYYLTVQNVKDLFGNAMTSASTVPILPAGLVFFARGDSGVVLDGSGNVVQWLDQTTNGNDASQFFGVPSAGHPGPSSRPAVDTFNNLQPTLDFGNGSGGNNLHWLQAASSPSLTTLISNTTMYAVVQFAAVSPANEIMNKTWGNLPAPFDWAPGSGETVQYGNGYNNAPASGTGGTLLAGVPDVLSSTITLSPSGGQTNFVFYLNGNTNGSGILRGVTGDPPGIYDGGRPLWIGGRWDLVNGNMKGQIAEVMLFNNSLSGPDRTNVDNYLGQKYFPFAISQNLPATVTSSNGFSVTYTFGASVGSTHGLSFQWQENGTNIPGANGLTFTTSVLGPSDNGDQFDVLVTFPNGSTTNSATSTLTVLTEPPYVVTAGIPIWNTNEVVVLFDEAVDPVTAGNALNYSLNNGATVLSASIGDLPNKVVLTTSPLTWNANPGYYTLNVKNVKDVYGNTMNSVSPSLGLYPPTALWVKANNGVTPDGSGGVGQWNDLSGNGNNLNGFGGATDPVLATNNFGDVVVRFNATNDSEMYALDAPSLEITGDMSVFAVMNFANLTSGTNGEIVSKTGSVNFNIAAPYDYYMGSSSAGALFYRGNGGSSGNGISYGGITATNGPTVGLPHIIGVTETGNTVSQFIDNNGAGTGLLSNGYNESADADQGVSMLIGARGDNVNRLTGDIAEMIIMSSGMTSNEVVSLDNYLAASHKLPIGTNSYPVITQQPPPNLNTDIDATLIIPAGASGNPLALQWYDTNGVAISGQTNATLAIPNDLTSDAYYLVATNVYGSATSSVVSVTVISGLQVGLGPSTTLYVGQPFTFTAQAYGNLPLYYQWYQGGTPIPNATNSTYSSVASLGSISYSCLVTNGYNGYSSTNAGPVTVTGIAVPNGFVQTILNDHPVAYWRLNEPSGSTIAYDYVGGYNGTYGTNTTNGLPGINLPGFTNELGVAMDNTAPAPYTNGFINTPGVNLNTNTVTFLCWVYPFSAAETNSAGLIFYRVNGIVAGYQFANNNVMSYNWNNNPATYDSSSGPSLPANAWSMVALTITPSNAVIYVNGTAGAPNNVTNASLSLAQAGFAIGADPQSITLPSRIFNGKMDEAAIFNYTLSASQIQQLYTSATTAPVTVNTNSTNVVFSVANNQLTLSWPADHTGWQLQAQTNKLSVGISTNWVNVSGTTVTNKIIIPINLTNGTVFYRLEYP